MNLQPGHQAVLIQGNLICRSSHKTNWNFPQKLSQNFPSHKQTNQQKEKTAKYTNPKNLTNKTKNSQRESKIWQIRGFPHICVGRYDAWSLIPPGSFRSPWLTLVPMSLVALAHRDKCLHHAYGAVESKGRGWRAQFCSVPCSSGNKRVCFSDLQQRAAYGHTCLCLFVHHR